MAATRFSDSATPTSYLTKSRPKYTTTSGFANPLQVWPRRLVTRVFQITVNFTTFRALLKVFPVSELYYRATDLDTVHPVFLLKAFLVVHVRYGDNAGQNKAKKSVLGALEAKPEVEIWRRPVFLTERPRLSICPKVAQSTQLLPVLQNHFRFYHDDVLHAFFRITGNFATFRTISGTFVSTSGFWIVLPGHRFRFGAPGFLIESISSRLCALRRQYRPE